MKIYIPPFLSSKVKKSLNSIIEFDRNGNILGILLYGSVTREDFKEDSDIDMLLLIKDSNFESILRDELYNNQKDYNIKISPLIMTVESFIKSAYIIKDPLLLKAIKEGIILFDKSQVLIASKLIINYYKIENQLNLYELLAQALEYLTFANELIDRYVSTRLVHYLYQASLRFIQAFLIYNNEDYLNIENIENVLSTYNKELVEKYIENKNYYKIFTHKGIIKYNYIIKMLENTIFISNYVLDMIGLDEFKINVENHLKYLKNILK